MMTLYALYFNADINYVWAQEVQGELRLDKKHPRIYLGASHCIGLELLGKYLFTHRHLAEEAAAKFNLNTTTELTEETWEKGYKAACDKSNWLSKDEALVALGLYKPKKVKFPKIEVGDYTR